MKKNTEDKMDILNLAPFRLSDVRIYNINLDRCSDEENGGELEFKTELHSSEIDDKDNSFTLLLSLQTTIPDGENSICNLHLSVEGRFEAIVDIDSIKDAVIDEFRNKTGLYILWPYLRQYLHDITNRLRLRVPPIPMIDFSAIVKSSE